MRCGGAECATYPRFAVNHPWHGSCCYLVLMRERELRRFFLGLAAAATPFELGAVSCGGTVTDGSTRAAVDSTGGTGGVPTYVGRAEMGGTGGHPVFVGNTGGYQGTGGYPFPPGTGGYPFAPGAGGALETGGYPFTLGIGGTWGYGGNTGVDSGTPPIDAGVDARDAADPCSVPGCDVFCVPAPDAPLANCASICGETAVVSCEPVNATSPQPLFRCFLGCARRPEGLADAAITATDAVRAYFQEMSRLEAASVPAFRVLARELRAHGAPRSLIRAARRAARDEIRHARMGKLLAERFGGHYVRPNIRKHVLRSVEAIALDNAVEGCVRETFGALLATWQAKAATDPVVRRIMRSVAVDETRHAALNVRVARWADRQMDAAARQRIRSARKAAGEQVLREAAYEPSPTLAAIAGVPRSGDARRLAAVMNEKLWA